MAHDILQRAVNEILVAGQDALKDLRPEIQSQA